MAMEFKKYQSVRELVDKGVHRVIVDTGQVRTEHQLPEENEETIMQAPCL
jgi:hypothetical protein